jgi:SAM-dependent methyltransferase
VLDIGSITTGLRLGEDGVWYGTDAPLVSYPSTGHSLCYAVEESSFWFIHRNRCVLTALRNYPPDKGQVIFDVGGGNGFVSLALADAGFEVVLVEPGIHGARNARRRGLKSVICATLSASYFLPNSLGAVGLFDVIEHVENDRDFLDSTRNLMCQGGRLYATVPAYRALWSAEDVRAGHYRRYTLGAFRSLLEDAGFEVEFASYIFRFLPIPVFVARTLPFRLGVASAPADTRKRAVRDHSLRGGFFGRLMGKLLDREVSRLAARKRIHFGGSCLVVARNAA